MITLPTTEEISELSRRYADCAEVSRRWEDAHPEDRLEVVWGWYDTDETQEMHAWLEGFDRDLGGHFVLDLTAEQFGGVSGVQTDVVRYREDHDLANTW